MKPKDKNGAQAAGSSKQKKQLIVLGGLTAVFAVVMLVQFGGKSPDAAPVAQALEKPGASGAQPVAASDPAASAPAAPAAPAPGGTSAPVASAAPPMDNPVLSHPVEADSVVHSPFSNFWSVAQPGTGASPAVAPPTVTLNATMPSSARGIAIIDGELHFVGDSIGGWELADVQARSIVLRSPSHATVTIHMPLLSGASPAPDTAGG